MRHTSSRRHLAAAVTAVAALGTAAVVVPLLATSASAATYTASGTIARSALLGNPATDAEFAFTTCPSMPSQQGGDAYVFALPTDYAVAGTTVTLTGTDATNAHDLSAFAYLGDCSFTRSVTDSASKNLAFTLAAGETFLSVFTSAGSNVTVALAATQGATSTVSPSVSVSPTVSPSPSATTPPPPSGTRHVYPATPNDPLFLQDGANDLLFGGQWGMRKIKAPQAWQEQRATGAGIRVAVLDSGLDLGHPDFACDGKVEVVPGADPDKDGKTVPQDDVEGHGTHVAGIIGACTNNGTGVVGVAPDATIMPIQALSATSDADTLATALRTATDSGAHVINMSLGFGISDPVIGLTIPMTGTTLGYFGTLPQIESAIEYAVSQGVVVVAAAGNESSSLCGYPAIAWNVVCVGATDPRDLNAWYGNFPVKDDDEDLFGPALMAPGGTGVPDCGFSSSEILSTYSRSVDASDGDCDGNPGYASIQGTSMATPHVSGVAALVYDRLGGVRSKANADKVVEAMLNSAVDLYAPGYDPASGYGRVDALAAVKYWPAAADPSPSVTVTPTPTPTPTPTAKETSLTIGSGVPATVQYGDALSLSARLVDETGAPVVGESVTFQLQGTQAFREVNALTGADGVASAPLVADAPPGDYRVVVGYSGRTDVYDSSSASQPIAVTREDTRTTLVATGTGSKRTLTATVAEADDATRRVAGVTVTFWADGVQAGSATTNANGVATYAPKNAKAYEARYAGDALYLGSSGSA